MQRNPVDLSDRLMRRKSTMLSLKIFTAFPKRAAYPAATGTYQDGEIQVEVDI